MISKKIIKRSLVGLGSALTLTLGIAFAVNAMGNKEENTVLPKKANQAWYFTGSSSDDVKNPNNYSDSPVPTKLCGTTYQVICEIQAPDDGSGKPKLSEPIGSGTIADRIQEAQDELPSSTPPTGNSSVTGYRAN